MPAQDDVNDTALCYNEVYTTEYHQSSIFDGDYMIVIELENSQQIEYTGNENYGRWRTMKRTESPANNHTAESLALIEAVVNTRYGRTFPDTWKSVEQMRTWLIEHSLMKEDAPLTQGDHRRMIEVREALRALLYHNNGMPIASEHIETLNFLAKHAPLLVRFNQDGRAELIPDLSGVEGVIATLLSIVYTAMANGSWTRLKACRNERCQKAFYDNSKNHSGTWCAMARCGSRVKARAYRQRRQQQNEIAEELNDSV